MSYAKVLSSTVVQLAGEVILELGNRKAARIKTAKDREKESIKTLTNKYMNKFFFPLSEDEAKIKAKCEVEAQNWHFDSFEYYIILYRSEREAKERALGLIRLTEQSKWNFIYLSLEDSQFLKVIKKDGIR
jgi:hypothetical protein